MKEEPKISKEVYEKLLLEGLELFRKICPLIHDQIKNHEKWKYNAISIYALCHALTFFIDYAVGDCGGDAPKRSKIRLNQAERAFELITELIKGREIFDRILQESNNAKIKH